MLLSDDQLRTILLGTGLIEANKLDQALAEAKSKNLPLGGLLLEKDLIADENLGKIIADLLSFPFVRLSQISIPKDILRIIPEIVAKKQKIIAFKKDKEGLGLALSDPKDSQMVEFVKKKVGVPIVVYYATERDIEEALGLYTKEVGKAFEEIIAESVKEAKGIIHAEPPIIKIVETIISYAYQNKASDIHIEPWEKNCLVRFRIDGVLHDIVNLPLELHPRIVTRVKVLAKLRTDEHQAAQDGKLQYAAEKEELDIRVSIVPVTNGEKVVMRLLSERARRFSLSDLGLAQFDLAKVERAYNKPYGMILSTGPTGCGKTSTMYTVLKILNQRNINIMTIEDPVEYEIEGVNQIQVNPKTGLTFAKGLRSIVRQDPDIILVGEIRDEETAGIAINSAMTGHLVLSTLHTNDAATAIPRLLDMGVEPFLVASSVNVVIAQRLVRKICMKCRYSLELDEGHFQKHFSQELIKKIFGGKKKIRAYQGKGCTVCHNTGYTDRVGIFEVLEIDEAVREAIVSRADAGKIKEIAIKLGMTTMVEDGMRKIIEGITTVEEVIRVTKE